MYKETSNGILLFKSDILKEYSDIIHGFSTKLGGTSSGIFSSLNLSLNTSDKIYNVIENRRRLCYALGIKPESITIGQQVHKGNIKIVDSLDMGKGSVTHASAIPNIDSMITDKPGVSLVALSADCPLVICYDTIKKVIAIIHASWRGLSWNICYKTIKLMRKEFVCDAKDIKAVISPSIGPCCYEVKSDLTDALTQNIPYAIKHIGSEKERTYLDLWGLTKAQLQHSGIGKKNIESADICTKCNPELFYSYRRDGAKTGRFGAVIGIRD
jgi:YfiH family protein